MKKILAILLAAVLILGLLCACGAKTEEKTDAKPETSETTEKPAGEAAEQPAAEQKPEAAAEGEKKPEGDKAAETSPEEAVGTTVTVVSATVTPDAGSVTVPLKITGNNGLAGALVSVSYDKALTLTGIKAGSALGSLTCTPGGDLTANPVKILWDGEKADKTNGDIAYLTFTTPQAAGDYTISVSGDAGNFYDNDLKDVPVSFVSGAVTVNAKN